MGGVNEKAHGEIMQRFAQAERRAVLALTNITPLSEAAINKLHSKITEKVTVYVTATYFP